MLLSIIIPAYNVEKYITACLDSCLAQAASPLPSQQGEGWLREDEMEVIVVDDGSTDATPSLLAQYAATHRAVKVLRQENQGQSVARNLAIEAAQGDYIYMVDSDDRMVTPQEAGAGSSKSVLPIKLMRSQRYDIIGLQVWYQPEHGARRTWSHQMERWPFGKEFRTGADFVSRHNIEGLVYGYVFSRKLFAEHPELRFTPGIYHQDEELIFKIFTLAGPTLYTRSYTYIYYEHTGSSINTRSAERKKKLMADSLTILRNLTAWQGRHGDQDQRTMALRRVMHYKLSFLAMDVLRMLIRHGYPEVQTNYVIDELRKMGLYPLPSLLEPKYLAMKLLTCHPKLVRWWARQPKISRTIGF